MSTAATIESADRRIVRCMQRFGTPAMRYSLALIFIWFGVLKPFGLLPAEPLVKLTVAWMPLLTPGQWVSLIGWWEVAIGITFCFRRTLRIAIALLALQMVGTFMPLFILPDVTFQAGRIPFAPTMEGQYIIKNLVIISAALILGGSLGTKASRG